MADLSITPANVISDATAQREDGVAGEAVARGKTGYLDPLTQKWMLADNNSGTAIARKTTGIFLNDAANNQPVKVHKKGLITIGATLTANTAYFGSDTPGGICVEGDLATGEYVSFLGFSVNTTQIDFDPKFPGGAK